MNITVPTVAFLLLAAIPATSQSFDPVPTDRPAQPNLPPAEIGLEFEGSRDLNRGTITDIYYRGECPGSAAGAVRARFFSSQTPPGLGRRVIVRNVSRGFGGDTAPFTDRDYSQNRTSESTTVMVGTQHELRYFSVLEGLNDFEYEIKQGEQVINRGSFTATIDRRERTQPRSANCQREQFCLDNPSKPVSQCKKDRVRYRNRCSCPDGRTFFQDDYPSWWR